MQVFVLEKKPESCFHLCFFLLQYCHKLDIEIYVATIFSSFYLHCGNISNLQNLARVLPLAVPTRLSEQ